MNFKRNGIDDIDMGNFRKTGVMLNYPQIMVLIRKYTIDSVRAQSILLCGHDFDSIAIISIQAKVGSHPDKAPIVFCYAIDKAVEQTVFNADVLYFPILVLRLEKSKGKASEKKKEDMPVPGLHVKWLGGMDRQSQAR